MNRISALLALAAVSGAALAGPNTWQSSQAPLSVATNPQFAYLDQFASFRVDMNALRAELNLLPMESFPTTNVGNIVFLPGPDGSLQRFRMFNSPIQTPAMERMSGVHTYAAQGVDDPYATGRFDLGRNGFHGFVMSPKGDYVIEPAHRGDMENYLVFFRKDNLMPRDWSCKVVPTKAQSIFPQSPGALRPGTNLKTYRLAIKGTVEYTAFFGGVAGATNGAITSCNRVSGVYERDHAIRLNIVNNVMYAVEPDPYTNNSGGTMLGQNQTTCDANPGNANYDIGHVFSTGGGGIAGLQVVGITGQKARGVTGSPFPQGDGFDIDYVAHEMGHQYGANHTFNGTTSSCGGGNRSAAHAYEVGSGSTIMAYAGICGAENVQSNSDAYQHWDSQAAIEAWRNNAGSGGTTTATGNISPTANAGADFTIPVSTPFRLVGSGADGNGDALTYCWEQADLGAASPPYSFTNGPIFRSRNPSASPTRWFPPQTNVINNTVDPWDQLPNVARTLNMRLTVRDNRAGGGNYEWDQNVLTVVAGPFSVTAPNTAVSWPGGSTQTVTWTVGGSTGTPNVRILLSTDGGNSFFNNTATVLLASTPNDGSQTVTIPSTATSTARIIVEGVTNPFYDMSNVNFTITANPNPTITSLNPTNTNAGGAGFNLIVTGTNYVNGTSVVRWNGSNRTTTWNSATQLTAAITAADILNSGVAAITVANGANISNSLNFTINSVQSTVNGTTLTILSGFQFGGNLASLSANDSDRLIMLCDNDDSLANWRIDGTSPYQTVTQVQLVTELRATRTDLSEFVEMFNYTTNAYETIRFRTPTVGDFAETFTFTSNPGRFIQAGTRNMRAQVIWLPNQELLSGDGWTMSADRFHWTVNN